MTSTFYFIHCIFLEFHFVLFFYDFSSLLNFLFYLCIVLLILLTCLSMCSWSSLFFLKIEFFKFFIRNITEPHVFGVGYWIIIVILGLCHVFLIF